MTGIILSGGKSSRMGANKAFLHVGGERLIDRTVRIFKEIFPEVILVTNSPLDYLDQDCTIATDIIKGKGPLGGLYTGLFHASHERIFMAACDMPFLNRAFIKYMMDHCADFDIVVPELPDGLQPLHAIYSRRCLPAIKRLIDKDQLKITGFYKGLKKLTIPEDVTKRFDPKGMMFINVNTEEDLERISSLF
ncbi:MAG: molybdenum cofactor guanylyltransferase [Deltaproteobacteria bacterium]|nr:molybdenum cofactor guanylyltransferase [Deltaproteobacteria bacterium]